MVSQGATIEAKPKIKKLGDVTKFKPVALMVKRGAKDSSGRAAKPAGMIMYIYHECCWFGGYLEK